MGVKDIRDNLYYWNESLKNPEPIFDDYYIFDKVIICNQSLIKTIEHLRELIITYCVFLEKNKEPPEEIFNEIYKILTTTKDIQYNEFNAFWGSFDMTYTVFKKLSNNEKKEVIKEILKKYSERRLKLYNTLGFSNITVQALYDSGSSRRKGSSGIEKLKEICKKYLSNLNYATSLNQLEDSSSICYIQPDSGDESLFNQFIVDNKLNFEYGKGMQNKMPDFLLKFANQIFIIEAKHLKEGGGEQNKSVGELIGFVRQVENMPNIHYVAFMDGVYFNLFVPQYNKEKNKIIKQRDDIISSLKQNKNNFVINTAGLSLLLKDLVK